jgi:hypothetical protein
LVFPQVRKVVATKQDKKIRPHTAVIAIVTPYHETVSAEVLHNNNKKADHNEQEAVVGQQQ